MKKPTKILWVDVETTGLNPSRHAIIQIAGIIEINKKVKKRFNFYVHPGNREITERALDINGITRKQIASFPPPNEIKDKLLAIFSEYINKKDPCDKLLLGGYNVAFDLKFISDFFRSLGERFLFSYIRNTALDPLHLSSFMEYEDIMPGIKNLRDRKLTTMANLFKLDTSNTHDAMFDIELTRNLYAKMGEKIVDHYLEKIEAVMIDQINNG